MRALLYYLIALLLGATLAWGQERDAPRGRTEAEEGVEVLTRGPVHEAIAGTVTYNPDADSEIPVETPGDQHRQGIQRTGKLETL